MAQSGSRRVSVSFEVWKEEFSFYAAVVDFLSWNGEFAFPMSAFLEAFWFDIPGRQSKPPVFGAFQNVWDKILGVARGLSLDCGFRRLELRNRRLQEYWIRCD